MPGRKTDVLDCQWIQYLHSVGLLSGSFRPDGEMCALRAYLRHRANLLECRAAHIQHMQKALQQMNVQLTQVLSDITGETALAILRKIVAGDRDPVALAQLRDPRCRSTEEEIAKALTGNYRPEHVFALKQALALYDLYTLQLGECDTEIERQYSALKPAVDPEQAPLPPSTKTNSHCKNAPDFDVRTQLYRVTGVDLTAVDGLNEGTAQIILSEIGTDMSKWRTDKHFCPGCTSHPIMTSRGQDCAAVFSKGATGLSLPCAWRPDRSGAPRQPWTLLPQDACQIRTRASRVRDGARDRTDHLSHVKGRQTPYQAMASQEYERRQRDATSDS